MKSVTLKEKLSLIFLSLILGVAFVECSLRICGFIYLTAQGRRNQLSAEKGSEYVILCVGESTTAGGKTSYPEQLESILNGRNLGIKFAVINKGIPGTDSTFILSQLEYNLQKYKPDMVIAMMGINDGTFTASLFKTMVKEKREHFFEKTKLYGLFRYIYSSLVNKLIYKIEVAQHKHEMDNNIFYSDYYRQMETKLKREIEINPFISEGYLNMAYYYKRQGKGEDAERVLRKAIAIIESNATMRAEPNSHWVYLELLGYCIYRGQLDEVEQIYRKTVELYPERPVVYYRSGIIFTRAGHLDKASEIMQKLEVMAPPNSLAYYNLGVYYATVGNYDKAVYALIRAIELNYQNSMAWGALALCYYEQGYDHKAQELFLMAKKLRLENYDPRTWYNYQRLKEILDSRQTKLLCMQYPMRSINPLKKIFAKKNDIIFVDNEKIFKDALRHESYSTYFTDRIGGDFGHCTPKGNRLIADNAAFVIESYLKGCNMPQKSSLQ